MTAFVQRVSTGIDIGGYSIKAVTLSGRGGSFTLRAAASMRLPKEQTEGRITPEFLSGFARSNDIGVKRVAALMTGHSLMFRHFNLPQMPDRDLKEAVKWEIRKEVSIPPSELISDYVLAGNAVRHDNARSIIAFAAVRKEIDSIMALYRDSGLSLRTIEVTPTALLASFGLNNAWEPGVSYAALDIGEEKSTLAIFKDRRLSFAREIYMGGHDLTRAVMSGLKKGEAEADEMKRTLAAVHSGGGERSALTPALERLCSEVQRSFDYFQAQFREGTPSKLFLSGGTARLTGLDAFITGTIGIPAFADDPFRKIRIPGSMDAEGLASIGAGFTAAVGLAVRAADR